MHTAVTTLPGRAQVLAMVDNHPYARLTAGGDRVRGIAADRAAIWVAQASTGPAAFALGDPEQAVRLLGALAERGELTAVRRVHLPRTSPALIGDYVPVGEVDDWVFRWSTTAPPARPGEDRVVRLTRDDDAAIASLLDRAFRTTFTRPGNPWVRQWYGIRGESGLVACGADRSRNGTGELAAIAVDPDLRGRGLGAALVAAMTRRLHAEHAVVALGVMADKHGVARLYERLGFTRTLDRTSADVGGGAVS